MYFPDLNITLFGLGIWGTKIAARLKSFGVNLDVIDSDPGAEKSATKLNVRSLNKALQIRSDTHGIIVAIPSTAHFSILKKLIPYELPIFVEKPLTTELDEAQKLREYESFPVFVMHTWLYHPGISLIGKIKECGELGQLLYLRTNRTNWTSPRKDTDTIWNLLPHDLTIIRAILGSYPAPTFAVAEVHEQIPRGMICILGDRPHVMIEISNRYWKKYRDVRAHFELGTVVLNDEKTPFIQIYHGDHRSEIRDTRIEERKFSLKPDPLAIELLSFLKFLKGAPPPLSDLREGIEIVELIGKIRTIANLPV